MQNATLIKTAHPDLYERAMRIDRNPTFIANYCLFKNSRNESLILTTSQVIECCDVDGNLMEPVNWFYEPVTERVHKVRAKSSRRLRAAISSEELRAMLDEIEGGF